ncbi:MAG TPA: hypothetical protein VNG29_02500 [Candidatus Paceibacterota bacterium]|nr:hypothetical protein [Candidatus Paceibacterota bacterium]
MQEDVSAVTVGDELLVRSMSGAYFGRLFEWDNGQIVLELPGLPIRRIMLPLVSVLSVSLLAETHNGFLM